MHIDNDEHETLFTIPVAACSSTLANTKPSPEQWKITRYEQINAYLWVLEVVRLNRPAYLGTTEVMLKKVKTSPREAKECYARYLLTNGGDPFQVAFGTISMDNPALVIKNARENIRETASVRAMFDSYKAVLEDVEAERVIKSSPKFIDDHL